MLPAVFAAMMFAGYCPAAGDMEERWQTLRTAEPAGLALELTLPRKTFYQGERIPAALTFKNNSTNVYHLWIGTYDRSGRIPDIGFRAEDEHGAPVPDPLQWYLDFRGIGGGLGNEQDLGEWSIRLPANEWLRFDRPGRYRLYAWSNRPRPGGMGDRAQGRAGVDLVSDIVTIEVTPLTPAQEKTVIARALAAAAGSDEAEGRDAVQALRHLQTPAARQAALSLLDGRHSFDAGMALLGAPDPAREAPLLLEAACRCDFPVPENIVWLYSMLRSPRPDAALPPEKRGQRFRDGNEKAREEMRVAVRGAIACKKDHALLTTLLTLLDGRPQDRELREMLRANMEKLSDQQLVELAGRWGIIGGDDLLPVLRMAAAPPRANPQALGLLAKLAPDEARPLIVEDLQRATPMYVDPRQGRYGLEPLTGLPDRELPEVDESLRAKLTATHPDLFTVMPLVARYATTNLLPDVLKVYRGAEGRWACDIQNAALRYWIRCDPVEGVRALGRALQSRKETGCYRNTLAEVLLDQWTTNALPLLRASLGDADPGVAEAARQVLERHAGAVASERESERRP